MVHRHERNDREPDSRRDGRQLRHAAAGQHDKLLGAGIEPVRPDEFGDSHDHGGTAADDYDDEPVGVGNSSKPLWRDASGDRRDDALHMVDRG